MNLQLQKSPREKIPKYHVSTTHALSDLLGKDSQKPQKRGSEVLGLEMI